MRKKIKLLQNFIFVAILLTCPSVFSQYYYFDSGGNTYQQWCNETLNVRINSEGQPIRAGIFNLILDPTTTIYQKTWDSIYLRSFFVASTQTFINWTSEGSPSWNEWSDYTILNMDRNNGTTDYNWTNWLYATINFKPVFSNNTYSIDFWMEYISWSSTNETTLSKVGWIESINPEHQNLYRTWTIQVLQEPCVADTNNPTITNLSITDNSTKNSYLSWLTFSLNDNWWVNWVSNVPYIFTDGGRTGNDWWTITNQYGIDQSRFSLVLSWNSQTKTITNTSTWVSISWNWKTWQNYWLNANFSLSPDALFDFGIEKTISATFTFYDRAGNRGTKTIYFNNPKWPTLISNSTSPANGDVYVNLSAPIKLWIKDDWAGINPDTIQIILSWVYGTDYWPYVFSWDSLNLSWIQWSANQPDYYINISNHVDFPTSWKINVSVYVKDMEWNVDSISDYTFSTRPNCSEFQCCDPVLLDLWDGNPTYYTNTWLIVSGWNNIDFSIDGDTWTIYCNTENIWLSVYSWDTTNNDFVFFTDSDVLNIFASWIKWELSWDTLILSYIIDSVLLVIDNPQSGEKINTNTVDVNWHIEWSDNDDRLSWYVAEIYDNSGNFITWWFINSTWITQTLDDWIYEIFVYPVDILGNTWETQSVVFTIDRVIPICTLSIESNECTTWNVTLLLDTPDEDIYWFNFDGSDNYETWTWPVRISVSSLWYYTWYIRDYAGNTSWCSVYVSENILDNEEIIANIISISWYECQTITWIINVLTWISCGKDELNKFRYSRDNWINYTNNSSYWIYSWNPWVETRNVYIHDGARNTTGATIYYTWLDSWIQYNDVTIVQVWNNYSTINWKNEAHVSDGDCWNWTIQFSWFVQQWLYWTCSISGDDITYLPNTWIQYQWTDTCTIQVKDDEWNTQDIAFNFEWIDTKLPICEVVVPNACTNWTVQISISGDVTDIEQYSRWDMDAKDFWLNTITWVSQVWIYTWYVWDSVWNMWMCTWMVSLLELDTQAISYDVITATWYECETITWKVIVYTWDSCGKISLTDFSYSRTDWPNTSEWWRYSDNSNEETKQITITDWAWNTVNINVLYQWLDAGISLGNGVSQNIWIISWAYQTNIWNIINLFWAMEWTCETTSLNVAGWTCSGWTITIDNWWDIEILPTNWLNGQSWYCEIVFSDNEWEQTETWIIEFVSDTVSPSISIVWTNASCMSSSSFIVTWTFTENVNWFTISDINIQWWNVSNFVWNWDEYSWIVTANSMVEFSVQVPDNVAYDSAWNPNTSSNIITGLYDNVWPNDVLLKEKIIVYSSTSTLGWYPISDSWCAWVSGYNWEIYSWDCINWTLLDYGFNLYWNESQQINGLQNSGNYCRRVQAVDNFWSTWNRSQDSFEVDLSDIWCEFEEQPLCTNWNVTVTLKPQWEYDGNIYLSWIWTWVADRILASSLSTWISQNWYSLTWYIYQESTEKSNVCTYTVSHIDKISPVINVIDIEPVPECTYWTAIVSSILDGWCGSGEFTYGRNSRNSWNNIYFSNNNTLSQFMTWMWTKYRYLKVKDAVWNESTVTWVEFRWINAPIIANDFTWSENVWSGWKTANWKMMSNVTDWACGSGTIQYNWLVNNWSKWSCVVNWNEITYTPYPNKTWEDTCVIQVRDDENTTKDITIAFGWIDTLGPTCEITYEPVSCVSWNVLLSLTANETIWSITSDGGIAWSIDWDMATGTALNNWIYNIELTDLIGNVWYCSGVINNINTWLLSKPTITYPISWSTINDVSLQISRNPVESIWCRTASGYEIQICRDIYCNDILTWGYTTLSWWVAWNLEDREYLIRVRTNDSLWWLSDWEEIIVKIDKENPQVQLLWSNILCMSTNTFDVTWIFTEVVSGFEVWDISINGWTIENFRWTWDTYVRKVVMNPQETCVITVPTWAAYDDAGNQNLESNVLTWLYDNAWPNTISFSSWQDEIYIDNTILSREYWTDSWCAWVSGYNRELYSWSCTNWILLEHGFNSYWNESQQINGLQHSGNYCMRVQGVDNFWNEWIWSNWIFTVNLNSIWCIFEESSCNNIWVNVTLKPWNTERTGIYLSWTWAWYRENYLELTRFETIPWKTITGYIYQTWSTPKQSACYYTIRNIDQVAPEISWVGIAIGYECQTITWSISMTDEWCGSWALTYIWNWLESTANSEYGIFSNLWTTTTIYVTWYDGAWNTASTWVIFKWLNSPITRNNFIWSNNVWNTWKTVNWRILSNVSDWACGSWTIDFMRVSHQWNKWECVVNWDEITYIPNEGETGIDDCIIKVQDDEWSTGEIIVSREWIDTEKPTCMLVVQWWQSCTSGVVTLNLNSESSDVSEYSFDWETWISRTTNVTTWIMNIWIYTWYVKDIAWNISEICNVEVTWWLLDLDNPTLETTNWTWYECSTWSITVTWNDNSCWLSWLYYNWEWFINTTNINEIYNGNIWNQTVNVSVFDAVWHSITKQVIYTWQDVPVTWNDFTVENVGTWTTIDWFINGNISAWICEQEEITATTNSAICSIDWHNITYTPNEWIQWWETCTIVVSDWDAGENTWIQITVTFTGVDTKTPEILELTWWIWEQCTSENTFIVTWIFSEEMTWVVKQSLAWENVEISWFRAINTTTYEWDVKMLWWTWKVWLLTWWIKDLVWNYLRTWKEIVLWNYDNIKPQWVSLQSPWSDAHFYNRTIGFEWTSSSDEGCAWLSWYILNICQDSNCTNIVETIFTNDTWFVVTLQDNGNYYWTVVSIDANGNTNTWEIRYFDVESSAPTCSISQSECSNTSVRLTLTGNKDISINSWNISWIRSSSDTYYFDISENIDVWAIVEDGDWQTWYCDIYVSNFDNVWPDFTFGDFSVDEWTALSIRIYPNDTWCAQRYQWYQLGPYFGSNDSWTEITQIIIPAESIWRTWWVTREQVIRVKDGMWNITTKTWTITINDVPPTLAQSTWTLPWIYTWEVVVDVIDLLWISEWACWTGDLQLEISECTYATWYISWNKLVINMNENSQWDGNCTVRVKDNEGTFASVDWVISFSMDTKKPQCTGLIYTPEWWTTWDQITVSLTWCTENIIWTTSYVFTWNWEHLFEFADELGNTWEILAIVTWFDRESPIFTLQNGSGYECETWILSITNAVDTGIWLAETPYSFDWISWNSNNNREVYLSSDGIIEITWYVKDALWNTKSLNAAYTFNDSQPTATWFSVSALNWTTVNWKTLSDAQDWLCWNDGLVATVTWWNIWVCEISWDLLSYTPNTSDTTGTDSCQLAVYDDEWNEITIDVEITDINNYPRVELISPTNWQATDTWELSFVCTWIWNNNLILKYVYRIWSSNDDYTIEQTWSSVSLNLPAWTYYWNVYAEFVDWTTWWLSDTYSFNILSKTTPTPTGGGWRWHRLTKDKCPNWDDSDSYYDWTCEKNGWTHGSAGMDVCGVNASRYSDEQKWAYLYSYIYWITTKCPIQSADLDGYLIRSHFAKMISEFSVNVLGRKPEKWKTWCDKFDDINKLSTELHDLVITSCELWLMWLEPDWQTPSKSFNPDDVVTRAQFGTVLSRLLFWDMYNVKDEPSRNNAKVARYEDHLAALKEYGIMTQINGDWPNYLEKRGWVMIMLQRSDNYWIFAGKVPAKNWVTALFER